MQFLTSGQGILILVVFWLFMFFSTVLKKRSTDDNQESFLVANRNISWLRASLSIAASWIWAPALFIASQKAFEQGLPGVFWFIAPNILTLIVFGFLAVRIRELLPNGFTLPEYIARRYDKKTHVLYIFLFVALQICSIAVQLLAGASVVSALTGISVKYATLGIAFIFLSYSLISGLQASISTDVYQMVLILFTCFIVVPLALFLGDGWFFFKSGLGGESGNYLNVFDANVAYGFGIVVTIGLLAGPIGDQMHWQRAFSIKQKEVKKSYLFSGIFFGIVPILLSVLGFIAAGMVKNGVLTVVDNQLAGVTAVNATLPTFLVVLFVFMLLAGLASTGDSALCAASSLISVDVYKKYFNAGASDKKVVLISRITMFFVAILGVGIALIPGMKILFLFLFYGTLRACDMIPTVLSLYIEKMGKNSIFFGVLISMIIGLPLFAYGKLAKIVDLQVGACVGIVIASLVIPLLVTQLSKNKVNFEGKTI